MRPEESPPNKLEAFFLALGGLASQLVDFLRSLPEVRSYRWEAVRQCDTFLTETLPIGLFTGFFAGVGAGMHGQNLSSLLFSHYSYVSIITRFGILELFPLILGLILAGKVGATVAAEVASMKVNGQLDALRTMSIRPAAYLGWPRVLAAVAMLPVVVVISDMCAYLSSYLMSVHLFGWVSTPDFLRGLKSDFSVPFAFVHIVLKPALFGFLIVFLGYFFGERASLGAKGVGRASTTAAVAISLVLVVVNYLIGVVTN